MIKIEFKNFWKHYVNYLPILHLSIKKWNEDKYKYEIDFSVLGFCLLINFYKNK